MLILAPRRRDLARRRGGAARPSSIMAFGLSGDMAPMLLAGRSSSLFTHSLILSLPPSLSLALPLRGAKAACKRAQATAT